MAVSKLNTLTGNITITTPNSTITITVVGQDIEMDINLGHANTWTAVQTVNNNLALVGGQLNISSPSAGQVIQYNGTNWVNANAGINKASFNHANPANTTTSAMMGLGSVVKLTPTSSGDLVLYINFIANTTGGSLSADIYYGTGTAPSYGAAITGTTPDGFNANGGTVGFGPAGIGVSGSGSLGGQIIIYLVGLTVNTPYWFDIGLNIGASTTSSATSIYFSIMEI